MSPAELEQLLKNSPQSTRVLRETLRVAVPMWILKMQSERWTPEQRIERAGVCGQVVAEKGDVLQFGGRKGEAAEAFNRLAEGLAASAFSPGGVMFLGMRFSVDGDWVVTEPRVNHE